MGLRLQRLAILDWALVRGRGRDRGRDRGRARGERESLYLYPNPPPPLQGPKLVGTPKVSGAKFPIFQTFLPTDPAPW